MLESTILDCRVHRERRCYSGASPTTKSIHEKREVKRRVLDGVSQFSGRPLVRENE